MEGYFQRNNVFFNSALEHSPDCRELIDQLLAFKKGSGAHDDAPDALQSAIAKLNIAAITNTIPPRTTSRKDMISKQKNRF